MDGAVCCLECVVGGYLAAERQPAPLLGDGFGVPSQRNLLVEERIARGPILV
jgi:hypothetical protein